jgi:transcriptional regulator with XRE-family HTH domain
MQTKSQWLSSVLKSNGFSLQDLSDQCGVSMENLNKIIHNQPVSKDVWNQVLCTLNDYPTLYYPDASILSSLQQDIDEYGQDYMCRVFYGVNASNLIFCDYMLLGSSQDHGANVDLSTLNALHISLKEALQLLTKQNDTIS